VVYCDEAYETLAIVRNTKDSMPQLVCFVCSHSAQLNNVHENLWNAVCKDFDSLVWMADREDSLKR
jgi:hypothetical protein